jgi:hypothetical protein
VNTLIIRKLDPITGICNVPYNSIIITAFSCNNEISIVVVGDLNHAEQKRKFYVIREGQNLHTNSKIRFISRVEIGDGDEYDSWWNYVFEEVIE